MLFQAFAFEHQAVTQATEKVVTNKRNRKRQNDNYRQSEELGFHSLSPYIAPLELYLYTSVSFLRDHNALLTAAIPKHIPYHRGTLWSFGFWPPLVVTSWSGPPFLTTGWEDTRWWTTWASSFWSSLPLERSRRAKYPTQRDTTSYRKSDGERKVYAPSGHFAHSSDAPAFVARRVDAKVVSSAPCVECS